MTICSVFNEQFSHVAMLKNEAALGVSNYGFLLYTTLKLFLDYPEYFSLEMHPKRQYKICICSVILGELESFRNYNGFFIIFPKILAAI